MARYNFFAKNKDADITLRSRVLLFDIDGNLIKELQSASQTIQIRKTTFSLSSIDMSYPLTITLLQNGQPYREDIRIDSLTGVGFK